MVLMFIVNESSVLTTQTYEWEPQVGNYAAVQVITGAVGGGREGGMPPQRPSTLPERADFHRQIRISY